MVFIFDLDQTLVDSSALESHRNNGNWQQVYEGILNGKVKPYDGIGNILHLINTKGFSTGLVTSSPSIYTNKILAKLQWSFSTKVCYHDTSFKKPNPDPIIKALDNLNITKDKYGSVFSFGDRDIDIIASRRAGVVSVACAWGAKDLNSLRNSSPDIFLNSVSELELLLLSK